MSDILTDDIRGQRLREAQAFQMEIQKNQRESMVGKTYRVLVDGKSKLKQGLNKWKGRTNCSRLIHFLPETEESDYIWNWLDLKVTSATALSCQGEIVANHGRRPPEKAQGVL